MSALNLYVYNYNYIVISYITGVSSYPCYSDGDTIVKNDTVGHLLRTKSTIHEDGGVAALRAVLDSPYLV